MSKITKAFLIITLIYIGLYWIELKWWAFLIAPMSAVMAIVLLAISPKLHQVIFDDSLFKIKPTPKETND